MLTRILAAAVLFFALSSLSLDAGAKKTKKDASPAGTIEVYKTDKGEYRYRIKNEDGKTIAMPLPQMSWKTKADCLKAIEDLRVILDKTTPTDVKEEAKKDEK